MSTFEPLFMNNIFKYFTSFSLILILLVSTLQFSLYKMECLVSGKTKISLAEFDACNTNPKNDCSFSEKCCCFHEMNFDFNFETNLKNQSFKVLKNPIVVEPLITVAKTTKKNTPPFLYANLPPPGGMELLKRVQVFRL